MTLASPHSASRSSRNILLRMALLIGAVALLDALVGAFAARPFPGVVLIPALIPILMGPLVILPLRRSRETA